MKAEVFSRWVILATQQGSENCQMSGIIGMIPVDRFTRLSRVFPHSGHLLCGEGANLLCWFSPCSPCSPWFKAILFPSVTTKRASKLRQPRSKHISRQENRKPCPRKKKWPSHLPPGPAPSSSVTFRRERMTRTRQLSPRAGFGLKPFISFTKKSGRCVSTECRNSTRSFSLASVT